MSMVSRSLRLANGLIDRVLFLIGGIVGAQIPGFISHYVQRLGGHLDEARRNLEVYRRPVPPETLEVMKERVAYLQDALNSISNPNPFSKLYAFLNHLDYGIARNTLDNYVPNLPTTLEGVVYGLIGAILFSLIYRIIRFAVFGRRSAGRAMVGGRRSGG